MYAAFGIAVACCLAVIYLAITWHIDDKHEERKS